MNSKINRGGGNGEKKGKLIGQQQIPDVNSPVWIFLSIIFTGKLANTLKWIFKRIFKDIFKPKA